MSCFYSLYTILRFYSTTELSKVFKEGLSRCNGGMIGAVDGVSGEEKNSTEIYKFGADEGRKKVEI